MPPMGMEGQSTLCRRNKGREEARMIRAQAAGPGSVACLPAASPRASLPCFQPFLIQRVASVNIFTMGREWGALRQQHWPGLEITNALQSTCYCEGGFPLSNGH